jgi:hypothetical protein
LGYKRLVTFLLYSGSLHGWNYIDFHSRCDNKGATISLFKVKDGDCIGGFTKAQWTSNGAEYAGDSTAMLFNLSQQRQFPHQPQAEWAIRCYSGFGPYFTGDDYSELNAWNQPFNGENNCRSWANKHGYQIPL